MNPSQAPGGKPTGKPPLPQDQTSAYTPDVPDAAFGFADEKPQTAPVRGASIAAAATAIVLPGPVAAPKRAAEPPRPAVIAPTPQLPPQPAAKTPMPADVLPPQSVPAVPTLAPTPPPALSPQPAARTPLASSPAQASSAPAATTATFSPASTSHTPSDVSARIAEVPMRNSSDINKMITGKGTNRFKSIFSIVAFTLGIFIAAFLINQFVFQSYYVDGTSMTPTLQNNDRLIISKVEHTLANIQGKPYIPERGQIVVLDSSIVSINGQKEQLIKRVIGLPGDKIHIEGGTVTITNAQFPNGVDIGKELGLTNLQSTFSDTVIDLTVPQNQVYVMGDNRAEGGSYDSRSFGPIDGSKIQGRLWARLLPFDKAQLF